MTTTRIDYCSGARRARGGRRGVIVVSARICITKIRAPTERWHCDESPRAKDVSSHSATRRTRTADRRRSRADGDATVPQTTRARPHDDRTRAAALRVGAADSAQHALPRATHGTSCAHALSLLLRLLLLLHLWLTPGKVGLLLVLFAEHARELHLAVLILAERLVEGA